MPTHSRVWTQTQCAVWGVVDVLSHRFRECLIPSLPPPRPPPSPHTNSSCLIAPRAVIAGRKSWRWACPSRARASLLTPVCGSREPQLDARWPAQVDMHVSPSALEIASRLPDPGAVFRGPLLGDFAVGWTRASRRLGKRCTPSPARPFGDFDGSQWKLPRDGLCSCGSGSPLARSAAFGGGLCSLSFFGCEMGRLCSCLPGLLSSFAHFGERLLCACVRCQAAAVCRADRLGAPELGGQGPEWPSASPAGPLVPPLSSSALRSPGLSALLSRDHTWPRLPWCALGAPAECLRWLHGKQGLGPRIQLRWRRSGCGQLLGPFPCVRGGGCAKAEGQLDRGDLRAAKAAPGTG